MKYIDQLETRLAVLFAKVPPLPANARAWIGANAWWIILIFAIIDAFGVIGNIRTLTGIATRNSLDAIYITGGDGVFTTVAVVSLVVSVIVTALYFAAVKPLKDGRKSGWNLVFYGLLIGFAYSIISSVLTAILFGGPVAVTAVIIGVVIGLVFAAAWLYLLFQIRGEFGGHKIAKTVKK